MKTFQALLILITLSVLPMMGQETIKSESQKIVAIKTVNTGEPINVSPFEFSLQAQIPISIDVDKWLNDNPRIKSAIYWLDYPNGLEYKDWTSEMKGELQEAVEAYANQTSHFDLDGLPPVTEYKPYGFFVSPEIALKYYVAQIAFSIQAEILALMPWRLSELDSVSLAALFDSRELLQYYTLYDVYQFRLVTPAPSDYIFKFLENNSLIDVTRKGTIERVIEWCKDLVHYIHMAGESDNDAIFATWQYYGPPPAIRIIEGTVRTPGTNNVKFHYTRGCHGTVGFIKALLNVLNIPTKYIINGGHGQQFFTSENLYLSHGDDPRGIRCNDVTIPASKLLIDTEDFQEHFGDHLSWEEKNNNCGYRVVELGVEYLELSYLAIRCDANSQGLDDLDFLALLDQWCGILRRYSYDELVSLNFFQNLDEKIARYGGCSTNNFICWDCYKPPPSESCLIHNLCFYGQVDRVNIDLIKNEVRAKIDSTISLDYLIPHFSISSKSRINYNSGAYMDFNNPINFEVTAENGASRNWTVIIEPNNMIQYEKFLNQGWTWFSLNVEDTDMGVGTVLNNLTLQEGDYIKNQTISATYYDGYGWFGDLADLDVKETYKIKLSQSGVLQYEGQPVDPTITQIPIKAGWNWIAYLPKVPVAIADALSSITPMPDDYIKNQTVSSTLYDGFGWFGDLAEMEPWDGFMLKSGKDAILTYPMNGSFLPSLFNGQQDKKSKDNSMMVVNPADFEFSGQVTAEVYLDGRIVGETDDFLMTMSNGRVVGKSKAMIFPPTGLQVFNHLIFENSEQDRMLKFYFYDSSEDQWYLFEETLPFKIDMIEANAFKPFRLQKATKVQDPLSLVTRHPSLTVYPNPASYFATIAFDLDQNQQVILEVLDIYGRIVLTEEEGELSQGEHQRILDLKGLDHGAYLIRIKGYPNLVKRFVIAH